MSNESAPIIMAFLVSCVVILSILLFKIMRLRSSKEYVVRSMGCAETGHCPDQSMSTDWQLNKKQYPKAAQLFFRQSVCKYCNAVFVETCVVDKSIMKAALLASNEEVKP